ncbi:MAG: S41 family peptidase, partial [Bacteroidota bacterium]
FYRAISGTSGMNQVSPKKSVFKGKLYVLINGNSLSAAAEFASFIKEYREATFIGEEAGGNRVQNTSGIALQIGLPNSNVIAEVPIILWKMNVKIRNEGHGVKPDYWVRNSIEDEMNNKDSVKSFTYELIEKSISNNGE